MQFEDRTHLLRCLESLTVWLAKFVFFAWDNILTSDQVMVWLLTVCCTCWLYDILTSWPCHSSAPLDNIRFIVIVWRLRGNIVRTALCWIVWHNVYSQQHTYMSSSYRSNRLGLSHCDPYAVCRGGCLELYYCNMVEWFWWDSSPISMIN